MEFPLEEVSDFGPETGEFRAWLGAVFASAEGRWVIRLIDASRPLSTERTQV